MAGEGDKSGAAATEAKADTVVEAAAAAPASFADEEIERYARAAVEVHKVNSDAALDTAAKQAGMAKAVEAHNFTNARFNEISMASQKDAALLERIQQAAARVQTAAAAGQVPATTASN